MCIACELGYLSMVDALEAERAASQKRVRNDAAFICEPATEAESSHEGHGTQQSAGEPAP